MKKFYEIPVVEITVFDVEDVITTSVNGGSTNAITDEQELKALISNIETEYATNNAVVGTYSTYNW